MILGRPERAFILSALFPRHLDVERLRQLAAGGLRWPALLQAAGKAGLLPAVALAAGEAGVLAGAPGQVRERLEGAVHQNAAQNAALLALLAQASDLLGKAGVVCMPIKGAALMLRDPGLVPLRSVSDVDLLVRREDVDLAASVLLKAGWRKVSRLVEIDVHGRPLPQGAEREDSPHGLTFRGATGLLLELHHALPSADEAPRDAGAAFFERGAPVRWGRHEIRCPSLEDLLAVACEHVLVHHREHLVHHPRLVVDLDALLALGADPERAKVLWAPDVGAAIDEGLRLMEEARRGAASPTALGRGGAERILSRGWRWSRALADRAGKLAGAPAWLLRALRAHGWRVFFPVRPYMVARYRVAPRSPAVPLLYLWRPVRWIIAVLTRR